MESEQQLNKMKPGKQSTGRLILLILLSTVFFALSWQSDTTAFFIFFAFVPVFFLLNDPELVTRDKPLLLILTFLSMFLTGYAGVYWIRNVNPSTHLVIAFLRGLTMFLPFLVAYLYIFYRRAAVWRTGMDKTEQSPATDDNVRRSAHKSIAPGHASVLVFIAAWIIMEVLHDLNIFGMSYGNLGHILAAYPKTIQWYAITGNLGGTLWILMVNLAIFFLVCRLVPQLIQPVQSQATQGSREDNSPERNTNDDRNISFTAITVTSTLAIAPLLISLLMYRAPLQTTQTNTNVIALHTSMDVYDYKYEVDPDALLDAYISSTKQYLVPGQTNIVFWPENALTGGLFMNSLAQSATVKKIRDELMSGRKAKNEKGVKDINRTETPIGMNLAEIDPTDLIATKSKDSCSYEPGAEPETEVWLVTGAIIDQVTDAPLPGAYAPQILFNESKGYHFKRYNTALFVSREEQPLVKKKKRLVPMSEQVPRQKIFAPLVRLVPNLEDMNFSPADDEYMDFEIEGSMVSNTANKQIPLHNQANSMTETTGLMATEKGTTPHMQTDKIRTSPIICYGSAFSSFTADEVKNTQSDFLAIILNEGWMQSNTAYRHFNWFAICRAIENRRFVVKSSNEGITTLIDSRGNTSVQLSGETSGAVTGDLRVNNQMTFYTEHHKGIVYGLLIIPALFLLWLWIGPIQKKPVKN